MVHDLVEQSLAQLGGHALQTALDHVVSVDVGAELDDEGAQPVQDAIDHVGEAAELQVRIELEENMDQLLHTARSMDVFRGVAQLALHHDELDPQHPARPTSCRRCWSLLISRIFWKR